MVRLGRSVPVAVGLLLPFLIARKYIQPLQGTTAWSTEIIPLPDIDSQFAILKLDGRHEQCQPLQGSSGSLKAAFENATLILGNYMLSNSSHEDHLIAMPQFEHGQKYIKGGVAVFINAFVQGEGPTIFDCESIFLPGGCGRRDVSNLTFDSLEKVESIEVAVLIAQKWGNAFYHSMVENLPRLAYVVDYLKLHPETTVLSYPGYLMRSDVHRVFFNPFFGLPSEHSWMSYNSHKLYHVRRLLVPTATDCGNANPAAIKRIQENTERIFIDDKGLTSRRTILVQKRAARGLTNHDDMMLMLFRRFGKQFDVLEFYGNETMDLAVKLHYKSDIVIGPHGAGLSYVMFMRRGRSGMVEIQPKWDGSLRPNRCHQATAAAAGIAARLIYMENVKIPFDKEHAYPVQDISFVLQTVDSLLDQLHL